MCEKGAQWLVHECYECSPFSHPERYLVGPFGPFLTPFDHLGVGQRLQVGPDPLSWCKMGRGVKIGGSRGPSWRLDALLGLFL